MNKLKIIGVTAFVVFAFAVVILQGSALAQTGGIKVSFEGNLKDLIKEAKDILDIATETTKVPEPEQSFGAISSPDIPYNYIGVGGLRTHAFGANFSASSTVCSFSPDFGTTTVKNLSFQTVGTTTATNLVIAKAVNSTNATTTVLAYHDFAAEVKGTYFLMASTTDSDGSGDGRDDEWTLSPDDVLNFNVQGLVNTVNDSSSSSTIEGLDNTDWRLGTCGVEFIVH